MHESSFVPLFYEVVVIDGRVKQPVEFPGSLFGRHARIFLRNTQKEQLISE